MEIDSRTQQLINCTKIGKGLQRCDAAPGIICKSSCSSSFFKEIDCTWTNGYRFEVALILSVFAGMIG